MEVVALQAVAAPKESPKNAANKEKPNKKKRNDALLIQQLGNFNTISTFECFNFPNSFQIFISKLFLF